MSPEVIDAVSAMLKWAREYGIGPSKVVSHRAAQRMNAVDKANGVERRRPWMMSDAYYLVYVTGESRPMVVMYE